MQISLIFDQLERVDRGSPSVCAVGPLIAAYVKGKEKGEAFFRCETFAIRHSSRRAGHDTGSNHAARKQRPIHRHNAVMPTDFNSCPNPCFLRGKNIINVVIRREEKRSGVQLGKN